jgi:hypothetical protein
MSSNFICNIMESGNFWTAFSGLGGALLGGFITYFLQKKFENRKIREERKALLSKYSSFVDRVYCFAKTIDNDLLKNKINDPLRHINIPAIHIIFPEVDIKDPVVDLYFISETHDVKIISKIYNYKNRYIALSHMLNARNQLHIGQVQEILSATQGGGHGYATPNQIEDIIGKPLFAKMKVSTDSLYADTQYIINSYNDINMRLTAIFKYLYPGAKMIEFFIDN